MDSQHLNPSTLKSRFTARFLRALIKINAQKPISSSSPREIFQRYRRIKVAADKSMAYSVRSRRTWSRATLWKLQSRSRRRLASSGRRSSIKTRTTTTTTTTTTSTNHRAAIVEKTSHEKENKEDHVGLAVQAEELRELVPGGESMDLCNLLDETAHYIKCLTTQVQVMKKIANLYSLE
ncbi:hypothetical protein Gohar_021259 [Gossypium harknessii]|uniref:IBH1-like N-terminal domain-containing protein n=2 Tax=Gossypium TaxID=3633 RepID=A0A7J9IFA3_9ROSI|nr:hypothetical protein [Gossypium harknessii]